MVKKALILGIGGMDGSYLADILLEHGYEVHGLVRHSSVDNLYRIKHLVDNQRVHLHYGDLSDCHSVHKVIQSVKPVEIYNEADQDNVDHSFSTPSYSAEVTYGAVVRLLESVRYIDRSIKVFQPVTATMFGCAPHPQSETTPFQPQSPYACAKLAAYYVCQHYRREYGMFVSTAIFYNHESPRRTEKYLLHIIANGVVRVLQKKQDKLRLPGLDIQVDIGYAREYMNVAYHMLQREAPEDFVVATGKPYMIQQLVESALMHVDIPLCRFDSVVEISSVMRRPGKQPVLIGDCAKARQAFGMNFVHDADSIVQMLVQHALDQPTL